MNKVRPWLLLIALLIAIRAGAVTTIIGDTYNVTGSGTGFALNTGVNTGINPPTTRLTGTAKANLRYINTGTKATNAYAISGNNLQVTSAVNPGRFVLSADGTTSFDFSSALGTTSASPANRVIYDIAITINNNSSDNQRCSFAIGTAEGDANTWDFGVQLYRTANTETFYTIGKRIDTGSSGLASDLNKAITTLTPNTFGGDILVLIRVTDAGSEASTFNSRVQVSLNNGNSWIYDTDTDADLPSGFRFNGPARHIMWDVAGGAGPVTYDDFSVKLNPPLSNVNTSSVFKVMTYNIHAAVGPDNKVNTQRIANYIISQNVDLVGLNEVARFMARSDGRDTIAELAQQTGMTFVFSNNNDGLTGNDQFGNAMLSRYPVVFREHRLLPKVGDNEQRGWHRNVVDLNGKFLSFWVTHLDFHASDTERLMCGTNFNQWIADETVPVVFCGDFNDTPNTPIWNLLDQKWNDIWDDAGDGTLGRTAPCPGYPNNLNARIDYIWKARNTGITPTNAFVGYALEASDHYSVLSQFIFSNFTNHTVAVFLPFNEGTGTKTTDTVAGLSATFGTNAPTWSTNRPTSLAGDTSLYFDGTKQLTIKDSNQIIGTNGVNDDYTLQAWIQLPLNYAPAQRAILFQYERRPGFSFSINTNRTLHTTTFRVKDIASSATVPNDGKWHHVAVVHTDGANMKFYIDATLAATVTYTNGVGLRTDTTFTIGAASEGSNFYTGYLDRVRYDQRALAATEFDLANVPPSITTQPVSVIAPAGSNVVFSVAASGTATLRYQWRKDGVNISGATNSTLTRSSVGAVDAGSYSVVVTNFGGVVTSASATLAVVTPKPASMSVNIDNSISMSFSCMAGGSYTLQYKSNLLDAQWTALNSYVASSNTVTVSDNPGSATQRFYRLGWSAGGSAVFGFIKLFLPGNSDTYVSLPFTRSAAASTTVSSVSSNVISVSGSPNWTVDQFVFSSGVQTNTYYVRFISGALEGRLYPITANGANTLTLNLGGDSLGAVVANDSIVVEPYWTMATAFPDGSGVNISPTAGNRNTEILMPDQVSAGINLSSAKIFYFHNGLWKVVGQGNADHGTDTLQPSSHFIVRHNVSTNTTLVTFGPVIDSKIALTLRANPTGPQDSAVALARPVTLTLDQSQLVSSGAFASSPLPGARTDELLVFDNSAVQRNKSAVAIYYYWDSAWRRVGAGAAVVGSDAVFIPGTGVVVRKATNTTSSVWVNSPNY